MRKQPFTIPIWAHEIRVEQKPGALVVSGKRHILSPAWGIDVENDLLECSKPLARWGEQRRKMPPHVHFANATTDDKLVEFVRKWGPFDGRPNVIVGGSPSDAVVDVVANRVSKRLYVSVTTRSVELMVRQPLAKLRRDQKLFSGAARLIAEIQKETPDADRVFEHYSQLPESEDRELFFRVVESLSHRGGSLASAACQHAQVGLCHLLDRFPPRLQPTKLGPVESPPLDSRFIGRGIRSVLYFFLRLEYLRRLGLGVCPKCDQVFAKERRGAVYCDERCSNQHRSLAYYRDHGRARRKKKTAASKSVLVSASGSVTRNKR